MWYVAIVCTSISQDNQTSDKYFKIKGPTLNRRKSVARNIDVIVIMRFLSPYPAKTLQKEEEKKPITVHHQDCGCNKAICTRVFETLDNIISCLSLQHDDDDDDASVALIYMQ